MICKICGKEMEKQHTWHKHHLTYKDYYDKYLKKETDGICVVCGKPTVWNRTNYRETCSIQCACKNPERNEKIKRTNLERYGVENIYQKPDVKQNSIKAIKAGKRNYKCLYCGKDTGIKKFCSEECKIKYKENNGSYNNRKQAIQTCVEQFNGKMNGGAWSSRFSKIEQFEKEHNCTSIKKLCTTYGSAWKVLNLPRIMINKQNSAISNVYLPKIQEFAQKYELTVRSTAEDILRQDISAIYKGTIKANTRKIIAPLELDIYLPELKIAIEYNGTYWHSSKNNKDISYHLNKSLLCRQLGIRLIHIYEFEPYQIQLQLIKDLILGIDNYPKNDFNKNNLIKKIPNPEIIYNDGSNIVYGAGKLY